uniref:Esterase CalJ n=1 Tax=Emericella variicolor TaxID=1549217 RepID=A0A7U0KID3_EMEVA|nr:esterase CalJ' [Aspergillus stellatus]
MADFDALLADYTKKENPKVHGAIFKCVDGQGNEIYSKVAGWDSVEPNAAPLTEDVVLKVASATKLITSIALLQCVDKGLIGLDEPLGKHVPELADKQILIDVKDLEFVHEPSKVPITARHLLTHTSGFGYRFTHRLLRMRAEAKTAAGEKPSLRITERYEMPLVFEPGTGWLYGCSLDWAGVTVSRLNGGITLEQYFVENIWKKLGLSAPFPCFNIATHPEYNARTMGGAMRTPDGRLQPNNTWAFDNPEDQDGGSGLSCTAKDYVAVLADLISDSPKLLSPGIIAEMFVPQLQPKSVPVEQMLGLRPAWDTVSGPIAEDAINHGLGGIVTTGDVAEIGQPKGMLGWGGASNIVWWVNRDLRVAGFFATQQAPFGNPTVTALVNAWKKDFWTQFKNKENA